MKKESKQILLIGAAIAITLSALAPFLASSNPDGLDKNVINLVGGGDEEKAAEIIGSSDPVNYNALMPDYSLDGFGKMGEVFAILIGTVTMILIGLGAGRVLKKQS
jgi:cobalt/nickel transport protein